MFVTEHLIQQYLGLIHNNMRLIRNERFKDKPRERKLFYQVCMYGIYVFIYNKKNVINSLRPSDAYMRR